VQNLSEGRRRALGDRLHIFRIAAGSAEEVRGLLRCAIAFDYIDEAAVKDTLTYLDRDLAMLHRLTSGGRAPSRPAAADPPAP
jgi:four helix bundle protein